LETFSERKNLEENDRYSQDQRAALEALDLNPSDKPILDVVKSLTASLCKVATDNSFARQIKIFVVQTLFPVNITG